VEEVSLERLERPDSGKIPLIEHERPARERCAGSRGADQEIRNLVGGRRKRVEIGLRFWGGKRFALKVDKLFKVEVARAGQPKQGKFHRGPGRVARPTLYLGRVSSRNPSLARPKKARLEGDSNLRCCCTLIPRKRKALRREAIQAENRRQR